MRDFGFIIQPVFYWLFLVCVFLDGAVILARHFIKDETIEKKRTFLFYCLLGATSLLVFILSLIGLQMQDNASWTLAAELSAGGTVILGCFIYYTYPELWLQPQKKKTKTK